MRSIDMDRVKDMTKILLVEDDREIIKNLTLLLQGEGFLLMVASSQREALLQIEEAEMGMAKDGIDLILLDLSLPDGSGYVVCAAAKHKLEVPVIFLTAADDEANVVAGFDMGADDYIAKPFRSLELISRIKNILRRTGRTQAVFQIGNLKIDTVKGVVQKDGQDLFLSAMEYRLLLIFLNNQGTILSRNVLLEDIWDVAGDFVNDNTLTVYIKRLREKIETDPQNPKVIKTIRGRGYRLG